MSIVASLTPPPGLRVLVTAGAGGIGRRIAEGFLEAGAAVHVSDVDEALLDEFLAGGGKRSGMVADAADEAATEELVAEAVRRMGGLDVVVANAGIAGPTAPVDAVAAADWDATIDVDLKGVYLLARFSAPHLRATKGLLIGISSVAGRLGYAYRTPYAAAKWGVVGLVKSLAVELGPDGVRVNAILPGVVEGARIDRVIRARAEQEGVSFEAMRDRYLQKVSLRRMVSPDDVAAMCLFLAAPGGANVSGQAISVCGNVEVL